MTILIGRPDADPYPSRPSYRRKHNRNLRIAGNFSKSSRFSAYAAPAKKVTGLMAGHFAAHM
jgi:hypothetical protein